MKTVNDGVYSRKTGVQRVAFTASRRVGDKGLRMGRSLLSASSSGAKQ